MRTSSTGQRGGQRSGGGALATTQFGLFVLWPNSRGRELRILADLRERFALRRVFEVHWTPRHVRSNYQRFYSDREVRGVYHLLSKGTGPFLAAVIEDRSPALELRMTSRGRRRVNARFVDAKSRYRDWLGGMGVHCGETDWETQRDLTMLLGQQLRDQLLEDQTEWDGRIEVLCRDVSGTEGWSSAREMFGALGDGAAYVLLDGADAAATAFASGGSEPQILVRQYYTAHTVLGARALSWSPPPQGGRFTVKVGGQRFLFGLRFVGDGFLDEEFARGCLGRRVLDRSGCYCLAPEDALAVAAYRMLYHSHDRGGRPLQQRQERYERIVEKAHGLGLEGWTLESLSDPLRAQDLLRAIRRGPRPVRPRDPTVCFDPGGGLAGAGARLLGGLRRIGSSAASRAGGLAQYCYLQMRERAVLAAPWLRRLRALLRLRRR